MYVFLEIILIILFSCYPLFKIKYKKRNFIKNNKYYLLVFIILFFGMFSRLFLIHKNPISFNQDEVSIGYEAYSLLTSGCDRNGYSYPVSFISWGSGQNVLYAYLLIPIIKIFGLNMFSVRILSSIIGCFTLLIVFLFANKYLDKKKVLSLIFIFSIIPWHILKSRWALESNLFPDLLIWSLLLIFIGIKKKEKKYYIFSSIILGISLYSYGTSYLFVPLFLIALYYYLYKNKYVKIKDLFLYILIVGMIGIPLIIYVVINYFKLDTIKLFNVITIPRLFQNRMVEESIFGSNTFIQILKNILEIIKLLVLQSDNVLYNYTLIGGIYYKISIPVLFYTLYKIKKDKNVYNTIFNILFICSIIIGIYIFPNVNRLNIIWIPIIYYLYYFMVNFKNLIIVRYLKYIYIFSYILFILYLFLFNNRVMDDMGNVGLEESIDYALDIGYNNLYIDTYQQPYIYYLFYNKINPNYYLKYRTIEDENVPFQYIKSIKNVYFYNPNVINKDDVIIVLKVKNYNYNSCYLVKEYGEFFVYKC